jgi:hypothetical protein
MEKYLRIIFILLFFVCGCSNIPSTEDIDSDIQTVNTEINDAKNTILQYSGGLLAILANVRLETLKTTKSMLEQKQTGFKRFIPLSYSIEGKSYVPPANKDSLLQELNKDIMNLQRDLTKAKEESAQYGGGLLGVLSLTQVATIENSITFLNQKHLLLKHDIPYYDIVPALATDRESDFKPTPGEDINKF